MPIGDPRRGSTSPSSPSSTSGARRSGSRSTCCNGLPTIVVGLFVFGAAGGGPPPERASPASLALAIIMLPLIARASPGGAAAGAAARCARPRTRSASSRWRSVLGVVLPAAMRRHRDRHRARGRARGGRDRAADLRLARSPATQRSFDIFGHGDAEHPGARSSRSPRTPIRPSYRARWGAALVLLTFILFANIAARAVLARSREDRSHEADRAPQDRQPDARARRACGSRRAARAPASVRPRRVERRRRQAGRLRRAGRRRLLRRASGRSTGVNLKIQRNLITALIGPSGCGKTTFLRSLNRMNDSVPGFRLDGTDPLPRSRPLRRRRQPRGGAPADRHGLPEAQPVPEVDLRQRRLGAAQPRHAATASTSVSSGRCAARRSGTRSRTG